MAIDLTGKLLPTFHEVAIATTCTQIRVPLGTVVNILCADAVRVFNDVADAGAVPAAPNRTSFSQAEMLQGITIRAGGKVGTSSGQTYATICIAAQAGTPTLRVFVEQSSSATFRGR